MKQHEKADSAVREFSLPLRIVMYTEEQLMACVEVMARVLHLDATSSRCRKPQFLKCKAIYYYAMVFRTRKSTIPLFEFITAEHDIPSVATVLKTFKVFVLKTINKWPIVKAVVTDCSWVFINSILFE